MSLRAVPIAVAVVLRDDQVLIGPRPDNAELQGVWEFPGGKVETNEQPAAAVVREVREETGLEVTVSRLLVEVSHDYGSRPLELSFFECRCADSSAVPRQPFRFVPIASLADYRFPAANRAVLNRLGDRFNA